MTVENLINRFAKQVGFQRLYTALSKPSTNPLFAKQLCGSSKAILTAAMAQKINGLHWIVCDEQEEAAYFYNDVYNLCKGKNVLFFPSNSKKQKGNTEEDTPNTIQRTTCLARIVELTSDDTLCVISYAEAMIDKVVSSETLKKNTLTLHVNEKIDRDFVLETLTEYGFERVDFVYEAGQFAMRGSILDIFSFVDKKPYRLDFFGDEIESIRRFNLNSQLSDDKCTEVEIVPNLRQQQESNKQINLFEFLQQGVSKSYLWFNNYKFNLQQFTKLYKSANDNRHTLMATDEEIHTAIASFSCVSFGNIETKNTFTFNTAPQPTFNKNFKLLANNIEEYLSKGFDNLLLTDSLLQAERMAGILTNTVGKIKGFEQVPIALHEGFVDNVSQMTCYTDHQIFARYHRYQLHGAPDKSERLTIQELNALKVGDYVVHIDHGVGVFGGLVKQDVNGKPHEFIKLTYRDGDVLFVSVHGLHRISRYKSKESEPPKIYKLGNGAWQKLKNASKSKIKDIARDLIALYAKRKESKGFAFAPDSYLQTELEASFIYEDTPDQLKATIAVKNDMEREMPMDRLICGDVGFGKTEIAIRAAFKAVADSKQVAVLVPTTILALQHHKTFCKRLHKLPCRIEYISRFKSLSETKKILTDLEAGKIDIIVGTHKLLSSTIKFKNLGLLIVDEEQKFGVSAKEKLRQLRLNIDTLTLTATPIPRTLQFSLLGARDLSIIQTPPPNRQPIATEVHHFDEELIRNAIEFEITRGGQVFFVHNRVQDIAVIETTIRRICPNVTTVVAHGQMEGNEMEKRVVDFIMGEYDVLIATSIIENGIDIPNANTIIINQANHFGLSDLHQLRGRVGRSNRKAFCYLIAPALDALTHDARRRLRALEEFSDLGSGFNIAMQDLDIRGAGNLLGAEQSGFIAEMGFETYQKILNEAMMELREESKLTSTDEVQTEATSTNAFGLTRSTLFVADCTVETDMEILLPDEYVSNTAEKIRLYREIDELQSESEITAFIARMQDRFGKLPTQTQELLNVVRLRQYAVKLGVEKIILKNTRMTAYFVHNQNSLYYQSQVFTTIIQNIAQHPLRFKIKEQNDKLALAATQVSSINQAMQVLQVVGKAAITHPV
ncbi:MAG: transcription-repair coupling factor [Bacteroidales bacterium]